MPCFLGAPEVALSESETASEKWRAPSSKCCVFWGRWEVFGRPRAQGESETVSEKSFALSPEGCRLQKVKQFRKSEAPRHQSAVFSRAAGRCGLHKVKQLRKSSVSCRQSAVFSRAAGMSLGAPGPRARSLGVSQGPGRAAAGRDPEGGEGLR